jgi:hypothetical protein
MTDMIRVWRIWKSREEKLMRKTPERNGNLRKPPEGVIGYGSLGCCASIFHLGRRDLSLTQKSSAGLFWAAFLTLSGV